MKSRTALFLDNLILALAVFLLCFIVFRFYIDSLLICVCVSLSVCLGILMLLRVKCKKLRERQREDYFALLMIEYFLYFDEEGIYQYFFDAFKRKYEIVRSGEFLKIKDTLIAINLHEPLTLKKAVYYYFKAKRDNAKSIIILTDTKDKSLTNIEKKLTELRIEIFTRDKVYKLLNDLDSLPKNEEKIRRKKIKDLLINALSPNKSKGYLFMCFTLLFMAYFSVFSIYFIVFSAITLTLALVSKLNLIERLNRP